MDSGDWWAAVHEVPESDMTELLTCTHIYSFLFQIIFPYRLIKDIA